MRLIGILTFQASDNYGALLQAYSTYSLVNGLGGKPEIINYDSPSKRINYKLLKFGKNFGFKESLKSVINFPISSKKKKISDSFRKEFLHIKSEPLVTFEDLRDFSNRFEKIIVGSDQVWNYKNTKFDKRFFLDFVEDDKKKISYAASFGVHTIPDELRVQYKEFLQCFKHLTVREDTGNRILKEELGLLPSKVVLDPTLLLEKEEWKHFSMGTSYENRKDYILIYSVAGNRKLNILGKEISKLKNLPVIIIGTGYKAYLNGFEIVVPTVNEFVSLFRNASLVLTDSFHGTSFSINLNKDFLVYIEEKFIDTTRVDSLLKMVGLTNRRLNDLSNFESILSHDIDWGIVNNILDKKRNSSTSYLVEALGF